MKKFAFILFISVTACNPESSPEGRSKIRDQYLEQEIDFLKEQNSAILDSISLINKKLTELENR